MTFWILYAVMVVIDAIWLGVIAKPLFVRYLPSIMARHSLTIPAALLSWLLLAVGIWFFVLPCVQGKTLMVSFSWGALFGVCVYGVYELTNLAIFPGWALPIVFIDTAWGGFLCGLITVFARLLGC